MSFSNRVAVVTGSGQGIGRAIAIKLAELGATVVVNGVSPDMAPAVAKEIKAKGYPCLAVVADVSTKAGVGRLFSEARAAYGKVDILVNNAGIVRNQPAAEMTDENWEKVLSTNLKSVFLCTRAALPDMTKQRWGRIINISSSVGIMGNTNQSNYSAAKSGMVGYTRSIAKEVGALNITVNVIAPGFIETAMISGIPQSGKETIYKRIPAGYFGAPEDIAAAAVFLASDEARYITAETIHVDGGMSVVGFP